MSSELLSGLGARVRGLRHERGWSQRELAKQAGVSPRFLVQVEHGEGNLSLSRLADLAGALGVSPVTLLCGLGPASDDLDRIAAAAASLPPIDRRRLRLELDRSARVKIALVGIRGAGKSTVGTALAASLGCPFVALDKQVEAAAGMALSAIFEFDGEARYRSLCRDALSAALSSPGMSVLEVGGSLVNDPEAWGILRARARVVWLKASPEALLERVRDQGDLRPMAGWSDPVQAIEALLERRGAGYAQSDLAIDTEGRTPAAVEAAILQELKPALAAV